MPLLLDIHHPVDLKAFHLNQRLFRVVGYVEGYVREHRGKS